MFVRPDGDDDSSIATVRGRLSDALTESSRDVGRFYTLSMALAAECSEHSRGQPGRSFALMGGSILQRGTEEHLRASLCI